MWKEWGPRTAPQGRQRYPHPSPLDSISEKSYDVVPFSSGGLETLSPVEQDALEEQEGIILAVAKELWPSTNQTIGPWHPHLLLHI